MYLNTVPAIHRLEATRARYESARMKRRTLASEGERIASDQTFGNFTTAPNNKRLVGVPESCVMCVPDVAL